MVRISAHNCFVAWIFQCSVASHSLRAGAYVRAICVCANAFRIVRAGVVYTVHMIDLEGALIDVDASVVISDHFPSEIALANVASLGIHACCFCMTIVGKSSRNTALVKINAVSSLCRVKIICIVDVAGIALAREAAVIIVAVGIFVAVVGLTVALVDVDAIISIDVELVPSVADTVVGAKGVATSSMCRADVSICSTLVDVFTDQSIAHVLESNPTFAGKRARVIGTICLWTARRFLVTLVDVGTVAVHSVASPANVAVTLVASDVIRASSVDVTIVVVEQYCGVALVHVGACDAIAIVTDVTGAVEGTVSISTGSIVVTIVKVDGINWSTLIDVLANKAVTLETIVTRAGVASRIVSACCISVTNSWNKSALVVVFTETVRSVSGISRVAGTVPAWNFIKTEGISIAIVQVDHVRTFVNVGAVGRIACSRVSVTPVAVAVEAAVSIRAGRICVAVVRQFH